MPFILIQYNTRFSIVKKIFYYLRFLTTIMPCEGGDCTRRFLFYRAEFTETQTAFPQEFQINPQCQKSHPTIHPHLQARFC